MIRYTSESELKRFSENPNKRRTSLAVGAELPRSVKCLRLESCVSLFGFCER
ncbi:hypothetical protein AMTR_s00024p00021400 [Amborella trichopoda]|uniref:Uncharacterized protein n=1 Tax=Amborella trichopoda TaxID=13333 RepID=W1PLV3_AMBTC|nr:hypothetical protein AMTR_s00024p00021400 [Amborella trichopoda]